MWHKLAGELCPQAGRVLGDSGGAAGKVVIILGLGRGWLHDWYTAARAHVLGGQVFVTEKAVTEHRSKGRLGGPRPSEESPH